MKTFNKLIDDLKEELEAVGISEAEIVAKWILNNYTPPLEWEEFPPVPSNSIETLFLHEADRRLRGFYHYTIRTFIKGKWVDYSGYIHEHNSLIDVVSEYKEIMLRKLAFSVFKFIDSGNWEHVENDN